MIPAVCWLASYPKSGNTWFRMVTANLHAVGDAPADINNLPERGGIASARAPFDNILLVESGMLTHDEIDRMRPMLHRFMAQESYDQLMDAQHLKEDEDRVDQHIGLVKVHDGYTYSDSGEPLLGGTQAARGAIVIVRDPRDVAPSLANHLGTSVDAAITFMTNKNSAFCGTKKTIANQFRQQLLGWSAWQSSWLDQRDIPVHLVRYEDMKADPHRAIGDALAFAGRPFDPQALARAIDLASFERLQSQEESSGFREAPPGRKFFRRGESGGWNGELTPEQVSRIEADHGVAMQRLGYEKST